MWARGRPRWSRCSRPDPIGLTALRVVAPSFAVLAAVVARHAAPPTWWRPPLRWSATLVAAALALAVPAVAIACANGVAYGDERRYPLRTPPSLWLGLLPLAPLITAAGLAGRGAAPGRRAHRRRASPHSSSACRPQRSRRGRCTACRADGPCSCPPDSCSSTRSTLPDPVLFVRERIESLRAMASRRRPAGRRTRPAPRRQAGRRR